MPDVCIWNNSEFLKLNRKLVTESIWNETVSKCKYKYHLEVKKYLYLIKINILLSLISVFIKTNVYMYN